MAGARNGAGFFLILPILPPLGILGTMWGTGSPWAERGTGGGMRLQTQRFGEIDVRDDAIITFTQPIIGFQEFRRFVLLPGPTNSGLHWLQSLDDGELAFIVMDPRQVIPDYTVSLSAHERAELAVNDEAELDVYTLVVIPNNRQQIRTNLKAPILLNPRQRLAKQAILDKNDYPVRHYLFQPAPSHEGPEVSHARTHP